ncbi:unnamed protein product [Adineta ricciae]|uniref:Uncharacterized protein n=1 Tax=Adineta ricciae TaxID=249248 RepID=A0A814BPZ8_ADIRI|nr:unnamed protein product [Adineta ricciae]
MSRKETNQTPGEPILVNAREGARITEDIYGVKRTKIKSKPKKKPDRKSDSPRSSRKSPEIRSRSHSPSDQDSSDSETYTNHVPGDEDVCKPIRHEIQTVSYLDIGDIITKIRMDPLWFPQQSEPNNLSDFIYHSGITSTQTHQNVALFQTITNRKSFFDGKTVRVKDKLDELIIALSEFAGEYDGNLSFTQNELPYKDTYCAACGVGDLGTTHLLATDYISTARFSFHTELSYDDDLTKSAATMKSFVLTFVTSVAEVLGLERNEYIRVLSVVKDEEDGGKANVNLGVTTPDRKKTERLAQRLQSYATSGFRNHPRLREIRSDNYSYAWKPLLSSLQVQRKDFDEKHNFDYNQRNLTTVGMRGNSPYYVPMGWYRYALNVSNKYSDETKDRWLGYDNIPGEWVVAYYGTHAANFSLVDRDPMREESIRQMV